MKPKQGSQDRRIAGLQDCRIEGLQGCRIEGLQDRGAICDILFPQCGQVLHNVDQVRFAHRLLQVLGHEGFLHLAELF